MDEAEKLCDRVAIMDHGSRSRWARRANWWRRSAARTWWSFRRAARRLLDAEPLRQLEGVSDVRVEDGTVRMQVIGTASGSARVA